MKYVIVMCFSLHFVAAYFWSPAKNLGISGTDDMNPQIVEDFSSRHIGCVYQSYKDGNWDIFSRFGLGPYWGDTTWTDTFRVTIDTSSDIYPSIALGQSYQRYWCAWQNNSSGYWDIYVSWADSAGTWSPPYQLTNYYYDDELPSISRINDTVWVVWQSEQMQTVNIVSAYYDGVVWSAPIQVTFDSFDYNIHAKIGTHRGYPFVVWEHDEDIFYSHYVDGAWQPCSSITNDSFTDMNPDIAIDEWDGSAWVTWQTNRDGNFEIYRTACDTFDVQYRLTFHDSLDITPSYIRFVAPARDRLIGECIAFSTNRNSSYDIYSYWIWGYGYPDTLTPVDTNVSNDSSPIIGWNGCYLWVLWQSDRNGEWDIYGSYIAVSGITESDNTAIPLIFSVAPNPFRHGTEITVQIADMHEEAAIEIYDVLGRRMKSLSLQGYSDAQSKITWDGTDNNGTRLSPGVYFVRLQHDEQTVTEKIVLLR